MQGTCPPVGHATPPTGTAPCLRERPPVLPLLAEVDRPGFEPEHPYVRRWWTCVLGPTAVTDLLRLVRAARTGQTISRPFGLAGLVRAGLVRHQAGIVVVPVPIPPVAAPHDRRIPPWLRRAHALDLGIVRAS